MTAPESAAARTALAWWRTSLGLLGNAVLHVARQPLPTLLGLVVAGVALALTIGVLVLAHVRGRALAGMLLAGPAMGARTVTGLAAAVAALGVLGAAAILA